MIVIDSSVLAPMLVKDTPAVREAQKRLSIEGVTAPEIIDVEVASVYRKLIRQGGLTEDRAAYAIADLLELPIERVPHKPLMRRIWELHHNVTPYDAAFVALAELHDATLWTADKRLSLAPGIKCVVDLIVL